MFLDLNPEQFCDQPLVIKLGIQDIQPFSVLVSWQSRNHSGLHGYQVAYYSINGIEEVSISADAFYYYFYILSSEIQTDLFRSIPMKNYREILLYFGCFLFQSKS